MCGICGALALDTATGPPISRARLAAMTRTMRHRGPNDEGLELMDGAAIGARRLSIVDVDGGHQPLSDEAGTIWAAQNGELYNHALLRRELEARGHRLTTRCDTEVLPHLYEEHGAELTARLRGMFGLVVWDGVAGEGVVARDRLGIKPMYYAQVGRTLLFASELKALLASGMVEPDLDLDAIAAYLTWGFTPGPLTPIKGVRKLLPGERLIVGGGRVQRERWWRHPVPDPPPMRRSVEQWADIVRDELEESVRIRLMSDVPLGAMLSGGLDSSLIVALMARNMGEPVKTFSVGFRGTDSELPAAREVAAFLGTDHHELELPQISGEDDLSELVWHMDEPLADLSALGFLALSEVAAQHVTVALSGQGADELFGGYRKHRVASLAGAWQHVPAPGRALGAAAMRRRGGRWARLSGALQASDPVARLLASSQLMSADVRGGLFAGALAEHADAGRRLADDVLDEPAVRRAAPLEAALFLDAQLGLVDDMLHYFDRASMARSLEARVPFLDHHMVQTAARVPPGMKMRRLQGKHVLRVAAAGLVPDFVLTRRKQGFFNEAVADWIGAADGAVVRRVLLSGEPRYTEVIDRAAVERIARECNAGAPHHDILLALVMLELWLSDALPRAVSAGAAGRADDLRPV